MLELLVNQGGLIPDGHLPAGGFVEVGEADINLERVEVVAFLVELVGDVVAGALLPINPGLRIFADIFLLGLEQQEHLLHRLVVAAKLLEGGGEDETDFGHLAGVGVEVEKNLGLGNGFDLIGEEGERADELELDLHLVEFGRGGLGEAAEEIGGFVVLTFEVIGVGDFHLRLQDEFFVIIHVVQFQFERAGHDGVEFRNGQRGDAHLAVDEALTQEHFRHAWIFRIGVQILGENLLGLDELIVVLVHEGEFEERQPLEFGRGIRVQKAERVWVATVMSLARRCSRARSSWI